MAYCTYEGTSNRGNPIWGRWVITSGVSIEDAIVVFCRKAFRGSYKNWWVAPVAFDDKYFKHTDRFFHEVIVCMYPKLSDVKKEWVRAGHKWPATTFEEKDELRAFTWEIVHRDIAEQQRRGVEPHCISVKGVRFQNDKGRWVEKIKGWERIPDDFDLGLDNDY